MRVVVLVPRRADGGRRDQVWSYVLGRWTDEHPDWDVIEGAHDEGPFNRSKAINSAAAAAADWDVAIIADSDSFVGPAQIDAAVETCVRTGQMTLAYDRFAYLSYEMSNAVMSGFRGDWTPGVEWWMPGTCSSMVVVARAVWDEAGGFDEGFESWGFEDVAFSHMMMTFGQGLQRIPGEVWHLWHPTAPHDNDHNNIPRMNLYSEASFDRAKMRALIDRLKVELQGQTK